MTITGWLIFILILQLVHFLGTWKLYIKAGRKAWEAGVPIYNAIVVDDTTFYPDRKSHYVPGGLGRDDPKFW